MRCQCHTLQLLDIFQRMLPSHASQFEGCNMAGILKAKQLSNHRPFVGTISAKLSAWCWGLQPPDNIRHCWRRQKTCPSNMGENSRPTLSSCVETHQSSAWKGRTQMFVVGDRKQNALFVKLGRITPRMETVRGCWSSMKCGVFSGISLLRNAKES